MAVEGDAMQGPSSPTSRRARAVVRDETKPLVLIAAVGVRPSAARTVLPPPVDPSQEDVILVMEEDGRRALGACRVGHVRTGFLRLLRLGDEAVHRTAVDVGGAVDGPAHPSELASRLGLTRANTSHHLACLRGCGLVFAEPEGRQVRYQLADTNLAHALADLADMVLAVDPESCLDTQGNL